MIFLLSQIYEGLIVPMVKSIMPLSYLIHAFKPNQTRSETVKMMMKMMSNTSTMMPSHYLVPASSLATTSTRSEFCWRRVRSQNVTLAVSTLSLKMLIVTMVAALMVVMCAGGDHDHGDGDDDTDDDVVFVSTSPSLVAAIPSLVNASERPGKH